MSAITRQSRNRQHEEVLKIHLGRHTLNSQKGNDRRDANRCSNLDLAKMESKSDASKVQTSQSTSRHG